ncbi:MAG: hypothetical protein JRD69_10060, partial [Deltaproteobacteria bacterium]|nr:hypothetical protein [Deltaproteobacteria bacterium]
ISKTLTVKSQWCKWKTIREVYDEKGRPIHPVKTHEDFRGTKKVCVFEFDPTVCRRFIVVRKEWFDGVRQPDAKFEYLINEKRDDKGNFLGYQLYVVSIQS